MDVGNHSKDGTLGHRPQHDGTSSRSDKPTTTAQSIYADHAHEGYDPKIPQVPSARANQLTPSVTHVKTISGINVFKDSSREFG